MNNKKSDYFYGISNYKGCSYFSMASFNGLFELDDELLPHIICRFDNYGFLARNLYGNIIVCDEKVFLIPLWSKKIGVYDLKNEGYKEMASHFADIDYLIYNQAIRIGDKALLIPFDIKIPFALLDMKEERMVSLRHINDAMTVWFNEYNVTQQFTMFSASLVQDNIYMSIANIIFVIKVNTWQVEHFVLPDVLSLKNISAVKDTLYIACDDYKIVKWNIKNGITQIIDIPINKKNTRYPFRNLVPISDGYLLLPAQEDIVLKANYELDEWRLIELPKQFLRVTDERSLFLSYEIRGTSVVLYPHGGNGFLIYDMQKNKFSFKKMVVEDIVLRENRNELLYSKDYILEETVELKEFIDAIIY